MYERANERPPNESLFVPRSMVVKTTDDFEHLPDVMRFVMSSSGIHKPDQAKTLAHIIGVSVPQAYKKLNGRSDMTLPQIDAFNRAYGVRILSTVAHPGASLLTEKSSARIADALFLVGKSEVSCSITVGPNLRDGYSKRYAGYRLEGTWYVNELAACPAHIALYELERLIINLDATEPRVTTIAVVDDERGTADNLRDYLVAKGYRAYAFYDLSSARSAIELRQFDGYFLDWKLAQGTSEALIKHIRTIQPTAPIIVSTAGGADGQESQAILAGLVTQYGVSCHRKPMSMKLLTSLMADAIQERD